MMKAHCKPLLLFLLVVALAIFTDDARACTLWAAAGDGVEDGGTLLAKNRDMPPQISELRIYTPKTGYRFLGLFHVKGAKALPVAGINEKGLAIVSATASSIPRVERYATGRGLNEKLLTAFDSVDSLLADRELLSASHPTFYMAADRKKIAVIEVGPKGQVAVKTQENGVLFHTNHYLDPKLLQANEKVGRSSQVRLDRIGALMTGAPVPFNVEAFKRFSEDQSGGPDDSIWRTGSTPARERTLATWIVSLPKNGYPTVSVKLANPDEPVKTFTFTLDNSFWTERSKAIVY
jgi:predicted choloylglycine hydrolase